jgi:integrase/recombinase XerD
VADDDLSLALAEANEQTRVILLLGALAGLRASEMANLRAEDVDLTAGMLEVVDGKGGKARFVPVHDVLASALRALPLPTAGYVLVDANGRKLTRAQVLVRVRRVLDAPTHALRHTALSHALAAGVDLRSTQEIAGHRSISVTARYLHALPEEVRAAAHKLEQWRSAASPVTSGQLAPARRRKGRAKGNDSE